MILNNYKQRTNGKCGLVVAVIIFLCQPVLTIAQTGLPVDLQNQLSALKHENRIEHALQLIDVYIDSLYNLNNPTALFEAKTVKADLYRLNGQNGKAAELTDSLAGEYPEICHSNVPVAGNYYLVVGTLKLGRGHLKEGRIAIIKAIEILSLSYGENDTLLCQGYNKLGNYYYFTKQFDSAMTWYTKALDLAELKMNNAEERASYIQNKGIIYLELKDFENAERSFLESLKIKESLLAKDSYSLGRLYTNLAKFYQEISAYEKALIYVEKAENIFENTGSDLQFELGLIFWNKGLIYLGMEETEEALTLLFSAKFIIDSLYSDSQSLIASLNADIGHVYSNKGDKEKAVFYYNSVLKTANQQLKIKIIRNLAHFYTYENDLIKAEAYFKELFMINNNSENITSKVLTYIYYGLFLLEKNEDSALYYFNQGFELLSKKESFHQREIAVSIASIGDYYLSQRNFIDALRYYHKCLIIISNTFKETNYFVTPNHWNFSPDIRTVNYLMKKAFCLYKCYEDNLDIKYLVSASETFQQGYNLTYNLWANIKSEGSKFNYQKEFQWAHPIAIQTNLELYELTQDKKWLNRAFEISERGKAMTLLSELKDLNAKKIGAIPEDILTFERELKRNIYVYRNRITEEERTNSKDDKKLCYLHYNLLKLEKKYDSLNQVITNNYPGNSLTKYDPDIISLEDLQDVLENDEVILEYSYTDDKLYTFVITKDRVNVKHTELFDPLAKDIFRLKNNLDFNRVHEYNLNDYMQFQISSYKLYSVLIQPVEEFIQSKKIIIVPDNELNYLSFEALIENIVPSDTISFRNLPYLIKKCPVSYAPSSTIYKIIKKGEKPALNSGVLAMAPSTSVITRSFLEKNKELAKALGASLELPGIEWEANKILEIMHGKKLIGEEATEAEFKRLASSYDILHFATHTKIDDDNPLSSKLAFYPLGGGGEDGVLHTYEIFNLSLKGELAVLSACSTGDGKLMKGEGVISLARAFAAAGMPSVIMTLWDVEDISTGNIVPMFYRLLNEGVEKDAALRMAKMKYLEITKPEIETHPAFWSGFVLYGNNRGFKIHSDTSFVITILILLGLMVTVSIVMINKYQEYRKKIKTPNIDPSNKLQPENRV